MAKNLFAQAKKSGATSKADKHETINIDKAFEKDLKRMTEIDAKIAAERSILDVNVRDAAKTGMVNLYDQKKAFPGTLKVVSGKYGFQFITSDKYIKIDEEIAADLIKRYGKEVAVEKTVYTLKTDLVEKYGDVLSDLIVNSKKIAEEDKELLIQASTTWTVSKGMIEKLRNATFAKFNLQKLVDDIKPIFSIKAIKALNE